MKRRKATGLIKMQRSKKSLEILGWKHRPSAWYPEIGKDHKVRAGKELKEYKEELKNGVMK